MFSTAIKEWLNVIDDDPFETKESYKLTGLKDSGNNSQVPPFLWLDSIKISAKFVLRAVINDSESSWKWTQDDDLKSRY